MTRPHVFFVMARRMRAPLLVLIVSYALGVLGLVVIPGVNAQGEPAHLSIFHALYVITYTFTTTGFGELPHPFTDAQRLWITFALYARVIAWLYAIGALIPLFQDAAFRQLLRQNRFAAVVRRLTEPFYIVCGVGDTGGQVIEAMTGHRLRAVAIERGAERLSELAFANLPVFVPALQADAALPTSLQLAGVRHPCCRGVVALTGDETTNLQIVIAARLLNPKIGIVARADTHDTRINMESSGADAVVVAFDAFADRLGAALHAPDLDRLYQWLTRPADEPLPTGAQPPRGTWVLYGYGRFGQAVRKQFEYEGLPTVVIERDPALRGALKDAVPERENDRVTLRAAHIERAVGLIAGTTTTRIIFRSP